VCFQRGHLSGHGFRCREAAHRQKPRASEPAEKRRCFSCVIRQTGNSFERARLHRGPHRACANGVVAVPKRTGPQGRTLLPQAPGTVRNERSPASRSQYLGTVTPALSVSPVVKLFLHAGPLSPSHQNLSGVSSPHQNICFCIRARLHRGPHRACAHGVVAVPKRPARRAAPCCRRPRAQLGTSAARPPGHSTSVPLPRALSVSPVARFFYALAPFRLLFRICQELVLRTKVMTPHNSRLTSQDTPTKLA
jgi:hypothetical protein